ncbi:MAG: serine hydrolase [Acidobacteriota bacterium]|nr:serine hydrolase [Acidobacteriota bacterium]
MRVLALLLVLLFAAAPAVAQESPDSPVQAGITLLDTWIQSQMEFGGLPGLVIGIVHDQEPVWVKAYGHASLDPPVPMSADSIFRIASHSKLFTAIAVMRARDAGKLRLDDPVTDYLPWFDIRNRHPEARPVTVRHLLTHTAGLPRESIHPAWTDFEFPEVEALRDTVSDQETTYATETKWKYSNLGFTLAGMVAEAAAGDSFADLVTDGILKPLGMDSTSVGPVPADQRDRLATGYGRRMPDGPREVFPFVDARSFDPATGLSSTVPDMLRFLSWQMRVRDRRSEEVLASNTLLEMQRVQWLHTSWNSGWGLGFSVRHTEDRDLIGHGGGYPGYRTQTQLSPGEKIGVVVFTNGGDGNPGRYLDKAFEWVAPALAAARAEKVKPAVWSSDWDIYLGTYRRRSGDTAVLRQENDLVILSPLSEDPSGSQGVLKPTDTPHVFRLESDGFGAHGELVRFEVSDAGEVTRIFVGVNYSRRVR